MLSRGMATELAPGAVVAGFRVESLVGNGAMAEVYRACDEGDRVVALKLLDSVLAHDERFRQRFLRESELATSLEHPHIVPTLTSGEDGGRLYLAMELVEGSDLRRLLREGGRLDAERAIELVEQVADALDAAHGAGLVHRDVKPGNILVGSGADGEHAYVCDFGLARHVSSVSSLTGDRGFVGTIDYVPSEQIEGGAVDARADVYSLGCVLYECLAGVRPFDRDSELSVVFAHLNEPPPRLTDVRPELPAAFDEVFATALAKSPDDRYSSCGELAAAARAALRGEVIARRQSRRRPLIAAVGAIAVAGFGIGTGFLLTGKAHHPTAVTITPSSIGDAKLGDSNIALERLWGGGQKLSTQFPPNYSLLRQNALDVSAYFAGTTDRAVELITWNKADRTAAGVGPCSTVAQLKEAYGKSLKPAPGNVHGNTVWGYTVGKHLFFAMGSPPKPTFVQSIALYSDTVRYAGFDALSEGPCSGAAVTAVASTPAATNQARSAVPELVLAVRSGRFSPRVTVRVPTGWSVRSDSGHDFTLASPGGTAMHFLLDPIATANGSPLLNVSRTPPGLAAWLQHNRSLVVSAPQTPLLGKPALSTTMVDIAPSAKAPRSGVTYLTFRGPGYAFPLRSNRGEPVRLYLAAIRIDTLVHTLAIAVDTPSQKAFDAVRPAAEAILASLKVAAVPVQGLSPLSSYCTKVFGGTCLGELMAGTHSTSTFKPALNYTVPLGWTNFQDHPGTVGFVPPGGDWNAVDAGKSDYLGVFTRIATARPGCADGVSTIQTPTAFARWLQREPGLAVTGPKRVTIGGLSGYVADLRMRADWKKTCPWSRGIPAVQVLTSPSPSLKGLAHGMLPQPMVMRLYLLNYKGGTLGIEIDEVKGSAKLAAYSAVVESFRFALR